jgi:hypothetical protein
MRFRSIAVPLLSLCAVATAGAQGAAADPQCVAAPKQTRDACQQAVDMFQLMVPQLGIAITGGNATLGQGGSLGGLPHFTIGVRGNVLAGSLPDPQTPDTSGIVQRTSPPYPTTDQILGLPAVDVAIGLFKGLPLAVSNVGGVDLLLSAAYIPKVNADNVSVEPDSPLKIGYGVRIGLLQESLIVPGVGFTFLKRDLPKTTIIGTVASPAPAPSGTSDSLIVRDFDMKTTAWRLTASKSLVLFTLAAGVGQDKYDASTAVKASVTRSFPIPVGTQTFSTGNIIVKQKVTRTNYFADLSINLLLLKIVGEVGMVSGGDVPTHSTFDPKADAKRMYGSVGIRVGF